MNKVYFRQRGDSISIGVWTAREHELFLEGVALYPRGPWRAISDHVGARSIKQVQTHAQKYQQKLLRHQRGLRKNKIQPSRMEHRVDVKTVGQFAKGSIMRKGQTDYWVRTTKKIIKRIEVCRSINPWSPRTGTRRSWSCLWKLSTSLSEKMLRGSNKA